MYKQFKSTQGATEYAVIRLSDGAYIPLAPANTDYQKFKKDVLEGAELQDADGNVVTPDEAMAFISNLP